MTAWERSDGTFSLFDDLFELSEAGWCAAPRAPRVVWRVLELRRIVAGAFVTAAVASVAVVALVAAVLAGGPHRVQGPTVSPVAGAVRSIPGETFAALPGIGPLLAPGR